MTPLAAAFFAEVGILTVRDLSKVHRAPLPSEFLAGMAVFAALGVLAIPAPRAAAAAGWGLVVATLLSNQIDLFGPVGDFMGGKFGSPPGVLTQPGGGQGGIGGTVGRGPTI